MGISGSACGTACVSDTASGTCALGGERRIWARCRGGEVIESGHAGAEGGRDAAAGDFVVVEERLDPMNTTPARAIRLCRTRHLPTIPRTGGALPELAVARQRDGRETQPRPAGRTASLLSAFAAHRRARQGPPGRWRSCQVIASGQADRPVRGSVFMGMGSRSSTTTKGSARAHPRPLGPCIDARSITPPRGHRPQIAASTPGAQVPCRVGSRTPWPQAAALDAHREGARAPSWLLHDIRARRTACWWSTCCSGSRMPDDAPPCGAPRSKLVRSTDDSTGNRGFHRRRPGAQRVPDCWGSRMPFPSLFRRTGVGAGSAAGRRRPAGPACDELVRTAGAEVFRT